MIYSIIFTLASISAWIWIDVFLKVGREIHEASMKKKALKHLEDSMNRTYKEFKKEFSKKRTHRKISKEQI